MNTPADADGVVALEFRREFAAPVQRVWDAWTRAEAFAEWFRPDEFTLEHCRLDPRAGGEIRFRHGHPDMEPVWVRGVFLAVEAPHRLLIEFGFATPDGDYALREGFSERSRIEVRLAPNGTGTVMFVRHTGLTRDQGEGEGWRQTLERLQAFLTPQS